MKILVIDDDKFSRFVLRGILQGEPGCEVLEVGGGREAWALLEQGALPDLVILDLVMPDMSGLDLLRALRADPRFRTLKVILCSAANDRTTVTQAAALSIHHYILKPYSRDLILQQVRRVARQLRPAPAGENPEAVCARLGVDAETYLGFRRFLAEELRTGALAVRLALDRADLPAAESRLNALKGAAANLGASGVVSRIASIEAALVAESTGNPSSAVRPADRALAFKAWFFIHGPDVLRVLDELEAEGHALRQPPPALEPA